MLRAKPAAVLTSLTALLAVLLVNSPVSAWPTNPEMEQQKAQALSLEAEGRWKQIHWRSTADQALIDAKREHKPMLFVLVVNKEARKNAPEC